jgi:hypothetical protein
VVVKRRKEEVESRKARSSSNKRSDDRYCLDVGRSEVRVSSEYSLPSGGVCMLTNNSEMVNVVVDKDEQ